MSDLPILKHNGQRILTTQQLAEIYETTVDNIKKNFSNHKDNFVQGKHYYFLEGEELKQFKNEVNNIHLVGKNASSLYLWTERPMLLCVQNGRKRAGCLYTICLKEMV